MLLGLCSICLTCLGFAFAATAARPGTTTSRRRDLERRSRLLLRHPEHVQVLDVENRLLGDSIPGSTVQRVLRRAAARRLSARTMWRWAEVHGSDKLVTVVDAGIDEETLVDQLDAGTVPDWSSLGVVARLSNDVLPGGMPAAELLDLDTVPRMEDLTFPEGLADWSTIVGPEELSRFDDLPPIAGPGLDPFPAAGARAPQHPDRAGGDGDWPAVA